eukprot:scaffold165234_cov19-Prasinocladus_malaysianus.AAC.1
MVCYVLRWSSVTLRNCERAYKHLRVVRVHGENYMLAWHGMVQWQLLAGRLNECSEYLDMTVLSPELPINPSIKGTQLGMGSVARVMFVLVPV